MKKLELKDIAAYLPCGLVFQDKGFGLFPTLVNLLSAQRLIEKSRENPDVRPILHPMSDLTKEITHRGEKFVPIIELAKIVYPTVQEWKLSGCSVWGRPNGELICVKDSDVEYASYDIFDKLAEWMFDYRGLIPAGLAVDVNTLDENPYR